MPKRDDYMKKLLTLTLGGKENPSSNFRVRQYYNLLKKDSWDITEFNLKTIFYPEFSKNLFFHYFFKVSGIYFLGSYLQKRKLNSLLKEADLIWINKYCIEEIDLSMAKAPIVQDIDDAIFYNSNKNFKYTLAHATHLFVGNNFLKDEILKIKNIPIDVIPTSINLELYPKNQTKISNFTIGWIGSPYTNKYLIKIKDPINKFLEQTNSELLIISDKLTDFEGIFTKKCNLIYWDESKYINDLDKISIGLMPLDNTNWEKGKCSFKMLQYMALHKAVIVSPVGLNKEILDKYNCGASAITDDQWFDSLMYFYQNQLITSELGNNGRLGIEAEYSTNDNYKKIASVFHQLINHGT